MNTRMNLANKENLKASLRYMERSGVIHQVVMPKTNDTWFRIEFVEGGPLYWFNGSQAKAIAIALENLFPYPLEGTGG